MPDVADVAEGAVTVAYIHANEATMSWHHSLMEMVNHDMGAQGRVMRGGWVAIHAGTGGLVEARNLAVESFLKDRIGEWMFWVDTDMGFTPDTVDRLLEAADPKERPIMGGLCFALREYEPDGMGGYRTGLTPTIYDWTKVGDHSGMAVRWQYTKNAVTRCNGTGSACILIHRSVFEKIQAKDGPVWYDRIRNPTTGQLISEDLSFCIRAGMMEIPVYVHTGVQATHAKTMWLAEDDYDDQLMAEAVRLSLEKEIEPTAVLVPVLGRPQNAGPFMDSLKASAKKAQVYAVVGPEASKKAHRASIDAWTAAGARVLLCSGVTFAEKVNHAYRMTQEPWLCLVGDDVRFHPQWLENAQRAAKDGVQVVGTNDLCNPQVLKGEHTCHPLIRRSYVDEVGASWDGPGVVAHEGYAHWFVDNEIVVAARMRGVFAMAMDSVIEHLHPLFNKGETDAIYEKGWAKAKEDQKHFEERLGEHAPTLVLEEAHA